jgi:hypothetical protein
MIPSFKINQNQVRVLHQIHASLHNNILSPDKLLPNTPSISLIKILSKLYKPTAPVTISHEFYSYLIQPQTLIMQKKTYKISISYPYFLTMLTSHVRVIEGIKTNTSFKKEKSDTHHSFNSRPIDAMCCVHSIANSFI